MKTTPLLVAVTGPDGSGKSTACSSAMSLLVAKLGPGAVAEVSVWDALRPLPGIQTPFGSRREAEAYLASLDGPSRTLFIFHALRRSLQLGLASDAQVLLLNGYWYKYAVSELGYGVDEEVVRGAARAFPAPDRVFFLDVDPETAWERRRVSTAREPHGSTRYEGGGDEGGFLAFQRRLRPIWERLSAQESPTWVKISAMDAPDAVARRIAEGAIR